MAWECAECNRAGRNVTNLEHAEKCQYCYAPRNSVKRDALAERWKHSQSALGVVYSTPVLDRPKPPPAVDWVLTRDAFFWVCIIVALGIAYFAGYVQGEAR